MLTYNNVHQYFFFLLAFSCDIKTNYKPPQSCSEYPLVYNLDGPLSQQGDENGRQIKSMTESDIAIHGNEENEESNQGNDSGYVPVPEREPNRATKEKDFKQVMEDVYANETDLEFRSSLLSLDSGRSSSLFNSMF